MSSDRIVLASGLTVMKLLTPWRGVSNIIFADRTSRASCRGWVHFTRDQRRPKIEHFRRIQEHRCFLLSNRHLIPGFRFAGKERKDWNLLAHASSAAGGRGGCPAFLLPLAIFLPHRLSFVSRSVNSRGNWSSRISFWGHGLNLISVLIDTKSHK